MRPHTCVTRNNRSVEPATHAIGNDDVFGIETKSRVSPSDPACAKKMNEERIGGKTCYSFDHRGHHFAALDSIQPTANRVWEARYETHGFHSVDPREKF